MILICIFRIASQHTRRAVRSHEGICVVSCRHARYTKIRSLTNESIHLINTHRQDCRVSTAVSRSFGGVVVVVTRISACTSYRCDAPDSHTHTRTIHIIKTNLHTFGKKGFAPMHKTIIVVDVACRRRQRDVYLCVCVHFGTTNQLFGK